MQTLLFPPDTNSPFFEKEFKKSKKIQKTNDVDFVSHSHVLKYKPDPNVLDEWIKRNIIDVIDIKNRRIIPRYKIHWSFTTIIQEKEQSLLVDYKQYKEFKLKLMDDVRLNGTFKRTLYEIPSPTFKYYQHVENFKDREEIEEICKFTIKNVKKYISNIHKEDALVYKMNGLNNAFILYPSLFVTEKDKENIDSDIKKHFNSIITRKRILLPYMLSEKGYEHSYRGWFSLTDPLVDNISSIDWLYLSFVYLPYNVMSMTNNSTESEFSIARVKNNGKYFHLIYKDPKLYNAIYYKYIIKELLELLDKYKYGIGLYFKKAPQYKCKCININNGVLDATFKLTNGNINLFKEQIKINIGKDRQVRMNNINICTMDINSYEKLMNYEKSKEYYDIYNQSIEKQKRIIDKYYQKIEKMKSVFLL